MVSRRATSPLPSRLRLHSCRAQPFATFPVQYRRCSHAKSSVVLLLSSAADQHQTHNRAGRDLSRLAHLAHLIVCTCSARCAVDLVELQVYKLCARLASGACFVHVAPRVAVVCGRQTPIINFALVLPRVDALAASHCRAVCTFKPVDALALANTVNEERQTAVVTLCFWLTDLATVAIKCNAAAIAALPEPVGVPPFSQPL